MISLSAITKKEGINILLIGVSFIAGYIAHRSEGSIATLFVQSTPFYLAGLCIWTLAFHHEKTSKWFGICAFIFIASLIIEMIGVKSGFPFGEYAYGNALGPKLLGVPLVIGFNWVLLVYSGLATAGLLFRKNIWLQSLLGALLIVLLDFHIEALAPELDYWEFALHPVPLKNYLAWFVLCFAFQFLLLKTKSNFSNRVAPFTFVFMLLYFMALIVF